MGGAKSHATGIFPRRVWYSELRQRNPRVELCGLKFSGWRAVYMGRAPYPASKMSEPDKGTTDPGRLPEPALPSAAAAPFLTPEGVEAGPGQRWNRFTLEAELAGARHCYLAEDVGRMEKVLVAARLISGGVEWRRRAWAQLSALEHPKVVRGIDVIEEDGWRYEIMVAPSPVTLREWIAAHSPGFEDVESLVRQLSATLSALHSEGLVHLNLRPETIHIVEDGGALDFVLGGLQEATLYNQPELISIDVDPFYAPPEAAGLSRHPPGDRLCAWDWWSLGRVVQELMLGRHVLGVLLNRDVSKETPELRTRAEMLLLEREPPEVRAGAVETMNVEPAAQLLLRGLLTGSCDARWRGDAVQRWLRHENVVEHYDLPRTARLWMCNGRGFTLKEAAEFFTQSANWATGEEMLLRADQPGTLASFLKDTPGYREDWDRLQAVCGLAESPAWAEVPPAGRRTIATAVAWLALACASGTRSAFRVRGHTMDTTGLLNLLKDPGGAESVAVLRGLLHPPVIEYIEALDAAAARMLKSVAARGGAALKLVLENGWLDDSDHAGFLRLFTLSMERVAALQERVALLQATYATSRYPELARMLASRSPTPMENIVLAFTGEIAAQCGFVTHAEFRSERYHVLRTDADAIATALRWVRLHQLLRYGRLWGASLPVFAGVTGALTVVTAVLGRSISLTVAVALPLVLSRVWLWSRVRTVLRLRDPQAAPWDWRDGLPRAAEESRRVLAETQASPAELAHKMQALRFGMAEFTAESRRAPPTPDPHWWDVGGVFVVSSLVALVALWQAIDRSHFVPARPAADDRPVAAEATPAPVFSHVEHPDRSRTSDVVADPEGLLATGQYEVVDDGFGRRLRGPLVKWDLHSPPEVARLQIEARAPALPEQAAFALVSAEVSLRPYLRNSVNALIAIRVPTTRGVGLLVFNGRERKLFSREVFLVQGSLEERTWYELEGRRVFYFGNPLPVDTTISLAPP